MNIREEVQHQQWLEGLKPGDEVAVEVSRAYGHAPYQLAKVARVTKTQIALEGSEVRFGRNGGRRRGSSPYSTSMRLKPVTPDIREKLEMYELVRWANNIVTNHERDHPTLRVLRAMKKAHDDEMRRMDIENPPA